MRKLVSLVMVMVMVFSIVGCNQTAKPDSVDQQPSSNEEKTDTTDPVDKPIDTGLDTENPIYFAWLSPITGIYEEYGSTGIAACTIAERDINAAGGVLGRQLIIDYYDDKAEATESLNAANAIVDAGKYAAVIGNYSSTCAMTAIPIFEEAKLVYETPIASHADLTSMGNYIFRNGSVQSVESRIAADYMYNNGYKDMAVIYMTDDFGMNTWNNWSDQFESVNGGNIVIAESYIVGQTTDFTPLISKIMTYDVDGLYVIADYYNIANVAIQARDLGCDLQLFGPPMAVRPDTIELAGKDAEGMIAVSTFPVGYEGERFVKFSQDYIEESGNPVSVHAVLWYDTAVHLADAVNNAGSTDSDEIVKAIYENDFEALAGTFNYSKIGDANRIYFASQVVNGEWTYLDTYYPDYEN